MGPFSKGPGNVPKTSLFTHDHSTGLGPGKTTTPDRQPYRPLGTDTSDRPVVGIRSVGFTVPSLSSPKSTVRWVKKGYSPCVFLSFIVILFI